MTPLTTNDEQDLSPEESQRRADVVQQRNEYVEALHREAAGYIARSNWDGLDAVNAELAAQGEKAISRPKAAEKADAKPKK